MDDITCNILNDRDVAAKDVRLTSDGSETTTLSFGNLQKFSGLSVLKRDGHIVAQVPVDSRELDKDTVAGVAAEIGRQNLVDRI